MQREKIIILGSGPAGLNAALYTARANLDPLVLSGIELGGQVSLTYEVENYIGFPEGITGPDLIERMHKQAKSFGARFVMNEATHVDLSQGSPFRVHTHKEEYETDALIIATGASPKRLGIPGEDGYIGRGVSFCATCDGFFFRDKDVLVVGGGDSAIEESIFLTKFAKRVRVIHRRDELRAGETLKKTAFANEKIDFLWNTVLEEIQGEEKVQSVLARNVETNETTQLQTDGVFVFIGHYPNSDIFTDQLNMDEQGYVITDKRMMTSVLGVFAAGEIQDRTFRQISTSVGQGCAAALMAERWLR
jgi:thioredoxin reductase (NADPH)